MKVPIGGSACPAFVAYSSTVPKDDADAEQHTKTSPAASKATKSPPAEMSPPTYAESSMTRVGVGDDVPIGKNSTPATPTCVQPVDCATQYVFD